MRIFRIFAENCFSAVRISPKQVLTSTNQLFYPHFDRKMLLSSSKTQNVTNMPILIEKCFSEKYVMHSFAHGFHSNMVLCVRGQVSDQTGMGPKSKPNLDIFWAQKGPKYPPIVMVHNSYCQAQPQPQLNWAELVIFSLCTIN